MKLLLSKLALGDKITLCWRDADDRPHPFRVTVTHITDRGGICLEARSLHNNPTIIWMPRRWSLPRVAQSRNGYWLPKLKQAEIPKYTLKTLIE